MPSVMAIVSKAVFDKQRPPEWKRTLRLGEVWPTDRYASKHKHLAALEEGGDLYLVTVRSPGDLWLVAVLRAPKRDARGYRAPPNTVPIEDISEIRAWFRFQKGAPLPTSADALGMSLQTPRVLTAEDVALLEGDPPARPLKRPEAARRDKLLASIYADPTNHDLRQVCADGLLELGDPRGELITVQSRLVETPADQALQIRQRQLLKTHGKRWLGPLARFVDQLWEYRFERGFLAECQVNKAHVGVWKSVLATKDDPVWSTVHTHNGPLDLVFAPTMRALREIEYDGSIEEVRSLPAWRRLLADGRWPFERMSYIVGDDQPEQAMAALAGGRTLPALKRLLVSNKKHTSVAHLAPILTGAVLDQLERFTLDFNLPTWRLAADWVSNLVPLFADARVPTLRIRMSLYDPATITLVRSPRPAAYTHATVDVGEPLSSSHADGRDPERGLLTILERVEGLRSIAIVKQAPSKEQWAGGDKYLERALKALARPAWTIQRTKTREAEEQ
jgi:uncharacterized protein (TIGR02996 family)